VGSTVKKYEYDPAEAVVPTEVRAPVPAPTSVRGATIAYGEEIKPVVPVAAMPPETSSLVPGAVVPIPTLELVVSMSNRLLTLNAVVEDERVRDADPDVDVRLNAPVVSVNPLDAVRSPALVMVPLPVVEILPDVVTASPAVAVDSVVPVLDQ
jgi:hypothetical protein